MRFGRIPKREKQRLLDEMQSYMNSLNESATMDVDSSPLRETLPSPTESHSKEAISRAYRGIFASNSSQEHPAKRTNVNNNNTSPFQINSAPQEANFSHVSVQSHPNPTQGYQSCPASRCPVTSNDNHHTFPTTDNSRYSYPASSNQNNGQSNVGMAQHGSSANYNNYSGATQNQPSCPWKPAPGAKVLVSYLTFVILEVPLDMFLAI